MFLFALCYNPTLGKAPEPAHVLVLANAQSKDSLRVANDYIRRRQIPKANLIKLPMSTDEAIDRATFIETIFNPLLQHLLQANLIEAFEAGQDAMGRTRITVLRNPFRYLVLCYGVPVRIGEMDTSINEKDWQKAAFAASPQLAQQFNEGPLARNEASVDGELALMLKRDQPLTGFIPNPFFLNRSTSAISDVLKVCRLDGPSARASMNITKSAMRAEKYGITGRAYVDEDGRQGAYTKGNAWFKDCAQIFASEGFDLSHNTTPDRFSSADRFDAPVLYAGWYTQDVDGPPAIDGFRFPDGAIAAHLHSFSALPLRSKTKGWVGPLVHNGVAATFGNVAEPYLDFTLHFSSFFRALIEGFSFADAAYFAQPALSWQNIVVGDPLYQPFKKNLADQLEQTGDPLRLLQDQYVFIRAINIELANSDRDAAMAIATRGMRVAPGPALALRKAQLLIEDGQHSKAAETLAFTASIDAHDTNEWGLFADIADTFIELNEPTTGLDIYSKIVINVPVSHSDVVLPLIQRAVQSARLVGNVKLATDWMTLVRSLQPPAKDAQ
jgi:uncharacterized protein (TIGR03790 family)